MRQENTKLDVSPDDLVSADVSLGYALAMFMPGDVDKNVEQISEITNEIFKKYNRIWVMTLIASLVPGAFFIPLLVMTADSLFRDPDLALLSAKMSAVSLVIALIPWILWNFFQYGTKKLKEPTTLPYESNPHFDEFLSILQKGQPYGSSLSIAYYRQIFTKKRKFIQRKQFFGKLRYLLFSEDASDRSVVTSVLSVLPAPADIYISNPDLDQIIANRELSLDQGTTNNKPKRPPGPGRKPVYPYDRAVASLRESLEWGKIDLTDQKAAVHEIENWLLEWLEKHPNKNDNIPRREYVKPYAKKLYDEVKNLPNNPVN